MEKVLLALTIIITCTLATQPLDIPSSERIELLEDLETNSLLQHQEQARSRLGCHVCLEPLSLENCTAMQTLRLCETGFSCYTLQAFETFLNTDIFAKGCIPEIFCSENRGCEILNRSRNGTIESCSFYCCHTEQCNAGSSVSSTTPPLPTTTEEPTTLTPAPATPPGQCGGSLTSSSGSFASPNYPGNYPNNARCIWTTTVPRGSQLRIEFVFFLTERRYDYVKVYVGRRLVRHLTGKGSHKDKVTHIQGTSELISIVFRSDHSVTRRGFFAKYSKGKAPRCGGPLTGSSGNFKSPGYPGNYPNNIQCKWTITVPPGSYLVLAFRTFDTERCHDYVKIFVGSRLKHKLSGRNGRYRGRDDKRFLYQDDDDCDDDDDDDDDDDNVDDDVEDNDDYDVDGDDDDDDYDEDHNNNNIDDTEADYIGYHSADDDAKTPHRRYTYARRAKNRHVSRSKSRSRAKGRYGSKVKGRYESRRRYRHRFPYVARVYIRGTGEQISIVFKSNHRNRRKGFDAMYRVSQGRYGGR